VLPGRPGGCTIRDVDSPRILRFSAFELDLERCELRKAGRRVPIQQQPWKALVLLATQPGRLVTRDEIRQALWPDGTHVDFERGINFCLSQVRHALGDPARASHFIETLPRLGYRFVADVRGEATVAAEPVDAPVQRWPRWLAAACALGLAMATGDGAARSGAARPSGNLSGADAQATLARVMLDQSECGLRPAGETMPRAREAALAALRLDPRSADARVSLALVKLHYDWDWDAAGDLDRALAIEPRLVRAHLARAAYLSARGEADEAVQAARHAAALDPLCPTIRGDVGWYYYAARRYAEAAEQWRLSLSVQGDGGPRDRLVDALRQMGRTEDAWREAAATMRHAGIPEAEVAAMARGGAEPALRAFLSGSARFLAGRGASTVRLAALHAAAGEDDRALDVLERAARERSWGLLGALAADPDLARLEGQPRFERLLRESGLAPPMLALLLPPHPAP
jgi:DNA-binding winged helix-turn-helix (wHTH) protein/tetratricopeptide (TPR) repeat protein